MIRLNRWWLVCAVVMSVTCALRVSAQDLHTTLPENVGMSSERLERLTSTMQDHSKLRTLIYQSIIE